MNMEYEVSEEMQFRENKEYYCVLGGYMRIYLQNIGIIVNC